MCKQEKAALIKVSTFNEQDKPAYHRDKKGRRNAIAIVGIFDSSTPPVKEKPKQSKVETKTIDCEIALR